MRIVIDHADFQRLSPGTQKELLALLTGKRSPKPSATTTTSRFRWQQPFDLTPELARKLLHGLVDDHRRRLELFARKGGRVTMRDLLAVTKDSDWHVLSQFVGVTTRRLRRLVGDREKKAFLIGWDYDSTTWDKDHKTIIDGVYYVSERTAEALRSHFQTSRRRGGQRPQAAGGGARGR